MTQITSAPQTASVAHDDRIRSLRWGVPAVAVAAALSVFSVYGDQTLSSSQQASQEAALPWIIAVMVVLSGLLFGLGVPRLLRRRNMPGWALALSLAGIGPDKTRLEIWADPALSRNTHRIEVDADTARFSMAIEGVPSENPRTGRIVPLSVIAALRGLVAEIKVGT